MRSPSRAHPRAARALVFPRRLRRSDDAFYASRSFIEEILSRTAFGIVLLSESYLSLCIFLFRPMRPAH